jgi:hypothetical protein
MIYFDRDSLESFTGFATTSFKDAGVTMTASAWEQLVTQLDLGIAGWMHRWCGVPTFGSHLVEEYHNGRGENGTKHEEIYLEDDRCFYLREPSTSSPEVWVDSANLTQPASWLQAASRGTATGGDYMFTNEQSLGVVRFHQNVPINRPQNVKIIYWAGFPEGSEDLEQIRLIAKRLATGVLLYKKKIQESQTIRNTGVRDYSEMFELDPNRKIFTPELEMTLTHYRRITFYGGGFV